MGSYVAKRVIFFDFLEQFSGRGLSRTACSRNIPEWIIFFRGRWGRYFCFLPFTLSAGCYVTKRVVLILVEVALLGR
jgi:hypothetical protein